MKKFDEPIYVTRPLIPNMEKFSKMMADIWTSKIFSNQGPKHQALEKEIARVLKVPNITLFNNGTIALLTAIKCLRLSGEVITTPFTFAATPHALDWCGITPVFCDIEKDRYVLDASKIEALITPKTTGILAVHVFGIPCDVQQIQDIADRHGLKIIYDAAHAFQTEIDQIGIGNFGDITMYSFHPTKLFHTSEGGALAYRDSSLKKETNLLKNFGIKNEDEVILSGINGKMNEIQASVGLVVLEQLEEERRKRQLLSLTYINALKDISGVYHYCLPSNVQNSLQYFVIRINEKEFGKSRDAVHSALKEHNVFTRKYFHPLCSNYQCYRDLPSAKNLPTASRIVKEVLCLPFYGELSLEDASDICAILKKLSSF